MTDEPLSLEEMLQQGASLAEQYELTTEQNLAQALELKAALEEALGALAAIERREELDQEMRAELAAFSRRADELAPRQLESVRAQLDLALSSLRVPIAMKDPSVLEAARREADRLRLLAESTENIGRMFRVRDAAREAGLIE